MPVRPMLAVSTTLATLPELLRSDDWVTQIKADGHRFLIEIADGKGSVYNREGRPKVTNIPPAVLKCFNDFSHGTWTFDGELIKGGKLVLFDMLSAGRLVGPKTTFEERYFTLATLMDEWKPDPSLVALLPLAESADDKLQMLQTAKAEQREGVILRRRSGLYRAGRSTDLLRFKFEKDIDCIVTDLNIGGHDNVRLTLLDIERGITVDVGEASALYKKPKPEKGDVWTVRFLGVYDRNNPRLAQPRLMRKRTDKDFTECLFSQLDDAWLDREITFKTRGDL